MILELIAAAVGVRELLRKKNWKKAKVTVGAKPAQPVKPQATCGGCPACLGHGRVPIPPPPPAYRTPVAEPVRDLFWD